MPDFFHVAKRIAGLTGASLTMKDIAALLRVAPPSATGVIDAMVKAELLSTLSKEDQSRLA